MELAFSHRSFLYSSWIPSNQDLFSMGGQIYSGLFQIDSIGIYTLMPIGWKGRVHKSLDFALLWQKLSHCIRVKNKSKPGKGIASALCAGGVKRAWVERRHFHHICTTISKREVSLAWHLTAVGGRVLREMFRVLSIDIQRVDKVSLDLLYRLTFASGVFSEVCENSNVILI